MRIIAAFALVGLLGIAAPPAPHGKTSVTYYDTYGVVGPCQPGQLTIMNSYAPATNLSFPAGQGPQLVLSLCHFQTPHWVRVKLGRPKYGHPFVRQTAYTVTVDSPDAAKVSATWTDLGPTLHSRPGLSGTVSFTITGPSSGPQ